MRREQRLWIGGSHELAGEPAGEVPPDGLEHPDVALRCGRKGRVPAEIRTAGEVDLRKASGLPDGLPHGLVDVLTVHLPLAAAVGEEGAEMALVASLPQAGTAGRR